MQTEMWHRQNRTRQSDHGGKKAGCGRFQGMLAATRNWKRQGEDSFWGRVESLGTGESAE